MPTTEELLKQMEEIAFSRPAPPRRSQARPKAPALPPGIRPADEARAVEYYAAERLPDGRWRVRVMRTKHEDAFGHHEAMLLPDVDEEIRELPAIRPMRASYLKKVLNSRYGARPARWQYNGAWLVL